MPPPPRLSADDRRAQIIDAVTPAVLEHGAAITSRQLADAAGVAEGTLFKAFGDKESLLAALVEHHMTDAEPDLELRAESVVEVVATLVPALVERMRFMYGLVMALGPIAQRVAGERRDDFERSKRWIATCFEPFERELRVTPMVAADVLRTLAWAAAASWGEDEPVSSVDDIMQVLLHGIVAAPGAESRAESRAEPAQGRRPDASALEPVEA